MENKEKKFSETEQKEAFQDELNQISNGIQRCHQEKKVPSASRVIIAKQAMDFLKKNKDFFENGLLERKNDDVFNFLLRCMKYVQNGNINDKEEGTMFDTTQRNFLRGELLSFFNGSRDIISRFLIQNFSENKDEHWLDNLNKRSNTVDFCENYFEMIMESMETQNEKTAESVLSFIHTVLPFPEIAKKERDNGVGKNKVFLNHLALLAGDEEVLRLWTDEFLQAPEGSDTLTVPFSRLKSFFKSKSSLSYLNKKLDCEEWGNHLRRNYSREKYLKMGFTEEEIACASKLLRESVGDKIVKKIAEETYGLDAKKLIHVWADGQIQETAISHLESIRDLEKIKPRGAKQLFDGPAKVRCFGRYDTDFLLEQLKPQKPGEPYGVMCNAYEDHNGAFRNRQDIHKKIRDESARNGMKTRLMEYSEHDKTSFLEQLIEIAGEGSQQADYIWINQHGNTIKKVKKDPVTNKEIITEEKDMSKIEEVRKEWKHVFGVGPNRSSLGLKAVGSFMCFGGEEENVMDQLAKEYDIAATGATKPPSNIYGVKFERDEKGQLRIHIEYAYSSIHPGETKIYKY
jgi:hypothetical protein